MIPLGTSGNPYLRTVGEDQIIEVLLVGGWAYEVRDGGREAAIEATRAALARWVCAGLPVSRDADGALRYDPVEVLNFMKWFSLYKGDAFWRERHVKTVRRFVLEQSARCLPSGQEWSVVFRRTFNLASIAAGASIRLRLPLPLEDTTLRDLRLDLQSDSGPVTFVRSAGRLEARLNAPDVDRFSIAYRADFRLEPKPRRTEGAAPDELDADERELYTRPNEGLIRVTPAILSLAKTLSRKSRNQMEATHAFWTFLMDRLRFGGVHYHEIDMSRPMEWLLDNGWCDCQLGSALLVSLCRAANIPARIIGGFMLYPLSPGNHYWTEIWIEGSGWMPFDLLAWDLSSGGRDSEWRNHFAGALDYRMKTLCLPRIFIGPMSVRFPAQWHILSEAIPNGIRMTIADIATGSPAYYDDISVASNGALTM